MIFDLKYLIKVEGEEGRDGEKTCKGDAFDLGGGGGGEWEVSM